MPSNPGQIASTLENPEFLFLPGSQRCSPELLFDLDELMDGEASKRTVVAPAETRPTLIPQAGWESAFVMVSPVDASMPLILERCFQEEGVLGVALIERSTGSCHGRLGSHLDPDVIWAQLQMVNTIMQRETVEDSVVDTGNHLHFLTVLPGRKDMVVCALVDSRKSMLARARLALRNAVAE